MVADAGAANTVPLNGLRAAIQVLELSAALDGLRRSRLSLPRSVRLHATTAKAAGCESDHAAEESPDACRDPQRHEGMPSDLNGGFGRAVFHRMASGDDSASNVPHVLFNGCPDWLRVVLDGLGRGLGHSSHGVLRFVNTRLSRRCESDARLNLVAIGRRVVKRDQRPDSALALDSATLAKKAVTRRCVSATVLPDAPPWSMRWIRAPPKPLAAL